MIPAVGGSYPAVSGNPSRKGRGANPEIGWRPGVQLSWIPTYLLPAFGLGKMPQRLTRGWRLQIRPGVAVQTRNDFEDRSRLRLARLSSANAAAALALFELPPAPASNGMGIRVVLKVLAAIVRPRVA